MLIFSIELCKLTLNCKLLRANLIQSTRIHRPTTIWEQREYGPIHRMRFGSNQLNERKLKTLSVRRLFQGIE